MPVKGKPGQTASMYVLLAILGLLVLIGVIIWMMVGGEHKNRQTGIHRAAPYVASRPGPAGCESPVQFEDWCTSELSG